MLKPDSAKRYRCPLLSTIPGRPKLRRALLLTLLLLAALAGLLLAAVWWSGLRVQGLSWDGGLRIAYWERWSEGCQQVQGDDLLLQGLWPIRARSGAVHLNDCPSTDEPLTQPPWTPPLDASISRISLSALPSLPPLALTVSQRQQHWQLHGDYAQNRIEASLDRASGQWSAQGHVQATALQEALHGVVHFQGTGLWRNGRWQGELALQGQAMGYGEQPQRANLTMAAQLQQPNWRLSARLDQPLAIAPDWVLSSAQPLEARGNLAGVEHLSLALKAQGPEGQAELLLFSEGSGLQGGGGELKLSGPALAGTLTLRWTPKTLTLAPAELRLPENIRLKLLEEARLPLAAQGETQLSLEAYYQELRLSSQASTMAWQGADWRWAGLLDLQGLYAGYRLKGRWQGEVSPQGLAGQALTLSLSDPKAANTALSLSLPVAGLKPPLWQTRATLKGRYSGSPLHGQLALISQAPSLQALLAQGSATLNTELNVDQLRLRSPGSRLTWTADGWQWQGGVQLQGQLAGYALRGGWQGRLTPQGAQGQAAQLQVSNPDMKLALTAPVHTFKPPHWPGTLSFQGQYGDYPLQGQLGISLKPGYPAGTLNARSRLPQYERGGELKLQAPWAYQNGRLSLGKDSELKLSEGMVQAMVIKPISLRSTGPILLGQQGATGMLALNAQGLVAARWQLPEAKAVVQLKGRQAQVLAQLPAWSSTLDATALLQEKGAQGRLTLSSPLSAAMSRGLGFNLQAGELKAQADWSWQEAIRAQGEAAVSGLALDWGGIPAKGGSAKLGFSLEGDKIALKSLEPLRLQELNVGTPLKDIQLSLRSDLSTWHILDFSATALGGRLQAPRFVWPSDKFQPITIDGLDLEQVAALQSGEQPAVALAGKVGGWLPLKVMPDDKGVTTFSVQGGDLRNQGKLLLKVLPTDSTKAMQQSNMAVQLVMDTLSFLKVDDFQAKLDMTPDGWLDGRVTIKGMNPEKGQQPVVLNYTHRENVLELLRSLRVGEEVSKRALEKFPGAGQP